MSNQRKNNLNVNIDVLANIALLKRFELSKQGMELFGKTCSYWGQNFEHFVYNFIDNTFESDLIVLRTREVEALIRCSKAIKSGMSKEKVYLKYIGYDGDENTLDNIYLCSRLNNREKNFVCSEIDYIFKEDENIFTRMLMKKSGEKTKVLRKI